MVPGWLAKLLCAAVASVATAAAALVGSHNFTPAPAASLTATINVERAPPDSSPYFWAQQFFPVSALDHGGYFGLQTSGVIGNQVVGKMLIFSIWNATTAEAGPSSIAQTFGGEGVGWSVRIPFAWQENVPYTFQLDKDGPLWWRLSVSSANQPPLYLGRIQITVDTQLDRFVASFTEYFGAFQHCGEMPYTRATFSISSAGSSVPPAESSSYGICAAHASGSILAGVAVHEVGTAPHTGLTALARVSGGLSVQTIVGSLLPATADRNQVGHVFAGAVLPDGSIVLRTAAGWVPFAVSGPASYSFGMLSAPVIDLVAGMDLRPFAGTHVYLGYGLGETAWQAWQDMMANRKLSMVHVVQ